ncbi:hypothetical protein DCAR_0101905 [Daucus carota subsp. sativus]|uniref:Nuclease HARBI1 n=1 Tax=Daucus carota subsp. sativus TaxID=79200 RepID=A0AAF0W472_DAUCS|nr:hypothetical protein DCAR_0101905 [Daucus carota subsp. sativus]
MDPDDIIAYLVQEEVEEEDEMNIALASFSELIRRSSSRVVRHGGSVFNHRMIRRNRDLGNQLIYRDYFSDNPTYPDYIFRRRFRMRRSLFVRIQAAIESHDPYFVQRYNAAGILGLSSLQKITAALRIIAYGVPADAIDDYIRIGESTAIESLKKFVTAIVQIFGEQYLRKPNSADINRLMEVAKQRGFPGMLGSIDCMHWRWKNCPTAAW